jgi:hypothetical protein
VKKNFSASGKFRRPKKSRFWAWKILCPKKVLFLRLEFSTSRKNLVLELGKFQRPKFSCFGVWNFPDCKKNLVLLPGKIFSPKKLFFGVWKNNGVEKYFFMLPVKLFSPEIACLSGYGLYLILILIKAK